MRMIPVVVTFHQNKINYIRNKGNNTIHNFLINLLDFVISAFEVTHVYCICMVEYSVMVCYGTSLSNSIVNDIALVA